MIGFNGVSISEISRLTKIWSALKEKGQQHLFVERILGNNQEIEKEFDKITPAIIAYSVNSKHSIEDKIDSLKENLESSLMLIKLSS